LQFCLVAGIPTLAAVFGILVDRIHYKSLMARFDRIDERFNGLGAGFDRIDERFNRMDALFDSLEAKFDQHS